MPVSLRPCGELGDAEVVSVEVNTGPQPELLPACRTSWMSTSTGRAFPHTDSRQPAAEIFAQAEDPGSGSAM
jgi:hypothetical protein